MKNFRVNILLASILATSSFGALAANQWENESKDAWIDGKAETTLLLSTNLNSFDIDTEVQNQVVTLTGQVDNSTEKKLAEELVADLDGVKEVKNELTINQEQEGDSETMATLTDSKITTIVKTRLLMDTDVSGTDIEVTTNNQVVTLEGHVDSQTEHDLAMSIANKTDDVKNVVDKLEIVK